jgi:tetratricopeptide (TPR) repeat protein
MPLHDLAQYYWIVRNDYARAEPLLREAAELVRGTARFPGAAMTHASALYELGRIDEADSLLREGLEKWTGSDAGIAGGLLLQARILAAKGDLDSAVAVTEEALDTSRPLMEGAHPLTLRVLIQLGELLHQQGSLDEAEARLAEATRFGSALNESTKRQWAAAVHADPLDGNRPLSSGMKRVAPAYEALAAVLRELGRADEAGQYAREAVRLRQEAERLDMEVTSRPSVRGSPN